MERKEGFEGLVAWQKARNLVKAVHKVSERGEFKRNRNLVNQIRRASISAMSNIAEGFEREGDKEFIQFLSLAKASCGEVRSQLYVAYDLGYMGGEEFNSLRGMAIETSKVISGLMVHLKRSQYKGSKFK